MSERADILLAALLLSAAAAGAAVAGAVAEIGVHGVLELGAVAVGIVTACFLFAFEVRHLPPAVVVLSLLAVGSTVRLVRALQATWSEQRLLRRLPTMAIEQTSFASLAAAVSIEVVPAASANAFCVGILRPRVLVTRGLLERLDEEEQRAAIIHELEHAAARGPLKVALARVVARTFFWLPALGDLLDRYILVAELEADRAAVKTTSRAALAGALLEVIDAPRTAGAVGLADFAAPRIDRLFDPYAALPPLLRRSSFFAALACVAGAAFLVACSPHLGVGESAQLHAMTVNLLVHHAGDRLLGLAETAGIVAVVLLVRRRLAG
jgi:Zn-dependent protease with chaperone function